MKTLHKILIGGTIVLSSLFSMQNNKAQKEDPNFGVSGWTELTKGINHGSNIRLYPTIKAKGFKLNSLTDLNKYFSFTKTNLSHDKLAVKLGKHVVLKPMATLHANKYATKVTADANVTAATDKYFGFFEVDVNPADMKNPEFFTYHNVATKIGNFGAFATGSLRDIKSAYTELEFTAKEIKNSGISPYVRGNFMKGVKATGEVGLSVNPIKAYNKISKRFNRGNK